MENLLTYAITICKPCLNLEGKMCHTPGCVFIRCTMDEVKDHLSMLLIKLEGYEAEPINPQASFRD